MFQALSSGAHSSANCMSTAYCMMYILTSMHRGLNFGQVLSWCDKEENTFYCSHTQQTPMFYSPFYLQKKNPPTDSSEWEREWGTRYDFYEWDHNPKFIYKKKY